MLSYVYRERRSVTQRVTFFLAVLILTTVFLAGCGGQEDTPVEEKEGASETTSGVPVESLPTSPDVDVEVCQTQEAYADLGPEGLQRLSDELSEEVSAGRFANMQEALASRGYTCNGQVQ